MSRHTIVDGDSDAQEHTKHMLTEDLYLPGVALPAEGNVIMSSAGLNCVKNVQKHAAQRWRMLLTSSKIMAIL